MPVLKNYSEILYNDVLLFYFLISGQAKNAYKDLKEGWNKVGVGLEGCIEKLL